eukprot:scaffold128688_cov15-Prasinocladus_malaysianus.AAC.1
MPMISGHHGNIQPNHSSVVWHDPIHPIINVTTLLEQHISEMYTILRIRVPAMYISGVRKVLVTKAPRRLKMEPQPFRTNLTFCIMY